MFAQKAGQIKNKLDLYTCQLKQAVVYGGLIKAGDFASNESFFDPGHMLVFLKHRLVLLSMPKCGSTALERAFGPFADIVIGGAPRAKHTPFRKYNRFLRPYLGTLTEDPLEVVCLFREPKDWLGSWWRYRSRDDLMGRENSTRGMSFEDFVRSYLDGKPGPAKVGRQAQFVSARDGQIGVDQVWRYEDLDSFVDWLRGRLKVDVELARINVSPTAQDITLSQETLVRLQEQLSRDFLIHQQAAR